MSLTNNLRVENDAAHFSFSLLLFCVNWRNDVFEGVLFVLLFDLPRLRQDFANGYGDLPGFDNPNSWPCNICEQNRKKLSIFHMIPSDLCKEHDLEQLKLKLPKLRFQNPGSYTTSQTEFGQQIRSRAYLFQFQIPIAFLLHFILTYLCFTQNGVGFLFLFLDFSSSMTDARMDGRTDTLSYSSMGNSLKFAVI